MRRDYLFHAFFLAIFLLLILQFAYLLVPFATPIIGGIVLWILAYPLHLWLKQKLPRGSDGFHAALSTLVVTLLILAPLLTLLWFLIHESQGMGPILSEWGTKIRSWQDGDALLNVPWVQQIQGGVRRVLGIGRVDFERLAVQLGTEFFGMVQQAGSAVAKNTVLFVFQLFTTIFTAFFLFRDGERLFLQLYHLVPMRAAHKDRLVERLTRTVTVIFRGSVLTSIFQTLISMVGYVLAGVPGALTLGVATGLASFIPVVGTALVWLPMGVFYLMQDQAGKALFLFGWGAILVATLDNLLRAMFIGKEAELPFLFLFFAILGGIHLYGIIGILIGPILVAIIPVFAEIYQEHYLRSHSKEAIELADDSE